MQIHSTPDKTLSLSHLTPLYYTPNTRWQSHINSLDKKKEGCDLRLGSKARLRARIEGFKPLTLKAQQIQRKHPRLLMQSLGQNFLKLSCSIRGGIRIALQNLLQVLQSINEELAEFIKLQSWNLTTSSYDDDDDEESSIPLKDVIMSELPPCVAITPDSPKTDSLIMVDKHLDTIPETESDGISNGLVVEQTLSKPK
ncbi:hypothetical protein Tco_0615842 [Tanacetum coccineum]